MHREAKMFCFEELARARPPYKVVEFGCRNVNGGIRDLLAPETEYIGVDVRQGVGVDVICDAAEYTPPWEADIVICMETLEHAENGAEILANAYRILKPGGQLILTMATGKRAPHSGVTGGMLDQGEFYRNVSPDLLSQWLREAGFRAEDYLTTEIWPARGDLYASIRKTAQVRMLV